MNPKRLLAISIFAGLIAVGVLWWRYEQFKAGGVTAYEVRGAHQAGGNLGTDIVARTIPALDPPPSQRLPGLEDLAFVQAQPLARDVGNGELVTFEMFQKSAQSGPEIGPGKRAVALEVNAAGAVGFLVRPGDYVDVIATIPASTGSQASLETKPILQAVKVLAVDQQYRLEDSAYLRQHSFSTVTVEVDLEEALKIEHVRRLVQGGFSLALRGKDSKGKSDAAKVSVRKVNIASPDFDEIGNR